MRQVLLLLKMCLISKKLTLACGPAMLALIFLSATNGLHEFTILNSLQGGIVDNTVRIDKPFIKIDVKDYLLDHLTGDFYRYYDKKWNPFINTGLH